MKSRQLFILALWEVHWSDESQYDHCLCMVHCIVRLSHCVACVWYTPAECVAKPELTQPEAATFDYSPQCQQFISGCYGTQPYEAIWSQGWRLRSALRQRVKLESCDVRHYISMFVDVQGTSVKIWPCLRSRACGLGCVRWVINETFVTSSTTILWSFFHFSNNYPHLWSTLAQLSTLPAEKNTLSLLSAHDPDSLDNNIELKHYLRSLPCHSTTRTGEQSGFVCQVFSQFTFWPDCRLCRGYNNYYGRLAFTMLYGRLAI